MEKLKIRFGILLIILSLLIIPTNVFAITNENIQIVKTDTNYIVYIKGIEKNEFKFATSEIELDPESIELNYINSVEDDDKDENGKGNSVAVIDKETAENVKFLYIKQEEQNVKVIEISFKDSDVIEQSKIAEIEKITKRIKTELLTNIEERNEEIDGVKYTETVGGLKIDDNKDADYEYVSVKLPAENYSELQELVNELNSQDYEGKNMYSKIEFAKEFIRIYESLIKEANNSNAWNKVENMQIKQPIDAQKGDKYVVLLKKVAKDETITYDAKFMTSYREDSEETIPGRTEIKTVKETAKLPVTGESLILFGILATIIITLIIVFIRMKKLQSNGKH